MNSQWIIPILTLAGVVVVPVLLVIWIVRRRARSTQSPEVEAAYVNAGFALKTSRMHGGRLVTATLQGTPFTIEVVPLNKYSPPTAVLKVPCALDGAFTITSEDASDRYFKRTGLTSELQVGDADFDREVYFESGSPDYLKALLGQSAARESVRALFRLGYDKIVLGRGVLHAFQTGREHLPALDGLRSAIEHLAALGATPGVPPAPRTSDRAGASGRDNTGHCRVSSRLNLFEILSEEKSMHRSLKPLVCLAALAATLWLPAASAQQYPARAITIVVPFGPGASTDMGARAYARALSEDTGQPVVVENKPGVDGLVGVQAFTRLPADGYSVLVSSSSTHTLNPGLYKQLPYDAQKDFIPVSMLYRGIQILVVKGDSPIKTLQDLADRVRANPGKVSFGASTPLTRLSVEIFRQSVGGQLLYVPYKAVGVFIADLMGGVIDMASADVPTLRGLIESGKLRALAVTSRTRHPALPNIPTMDESGLKGAELTYYAGSWLPTGAPPAIVTRLSELSVKAVKSAIMAKFINDSGAEAVEMSPSQLAAHQAAETEKMTKLLRAAGVQPQ